MRLRQSLWLLPLLVLSSVFLMTAAIPNVATGTWQTWNAMEDMRSGAAAVLLQDGRVLITGGNNAIGPVASADLFGTDGSFSAAAAMQTPRSGHTATVLSDGRVLVAGGITSGGGAVNTAEIYDPNGNSWSAPATLVNARAGHTASLLSDGRVLLGGGHDSLGNALSGLEIFDPTSGTFSSAGAMSSPRMNFASATLGDGRVLLIGGTSDGATALNSIDIYDPSAGMVSAGPTLSVARISATATTTLDGKVAVIGGNTGSASGSQDVASAEIFDPATGQLSLSASNLVSARSGHQAFLLPKNNAILVLGGSSSGNDLNSAELYYSWVDTFQATGSISLPRRGLVGSGTSQDGVFLAAGGTNLSSTELYGFATVKTDAADYPPGSTVTITGSGWQPGETVTLTLVESPLIDTHGPYTTVADSNGNITNSSFMTDDHDQSIRFYLTAVGSASQWQAQNTFTDSKPNTVTVGAQSPNPVAPASSAQYTVTVVFNGSGTACTSPLSVTTALPTGATASFNPLSVTNSNPISTLTIATTNATPPGSTTFTVLAGNGGGTCQTGTATNTGTLALVENTTTTLASSINPTVFGQSTTLTATVARVTGPTTPTGGTVTFNDGATILGTATLVNGTATLPVSNLTVAGSPHSLTASYAGVANTFAAISSNTVSQVVSQASTTTSVALTSGTNPSVAGQSLTFTATVTAVAPGAGTPTGTVTFKDGAATLGTINLTGNTAALTITTLSVGGHSIIATYNADANFTGSSSSTLSQTVNQASTTTAITSHTPNPSVVGQPVTIDFTVTPVAPGGGTPTGNVNVSDGLGDSCSASVAIGSCSITFTTAGAKPLTASYPGDTSFTGSASSPATSHTVNAAGTTTTITAHTPNPSVTGQPIAVNFSVTVNSPGSGTIPGAETISVSDGTGDTCSGTLAAGTCQLTPSTSGAKTLTATFDGDTNFATSTSAGVSHTVNKRATTTSVNLSLTSVVVGQLSTATVTVTDTDAGTQTNPTGMVTFGSTDAGDSFGTCTLAPSGSNAATCTASVTPSRVGTSPHTITATFPPDSTHATSSGNASLTVNKASTTTTISSNTPNPSTVGQSVTINYSVAVTAPGAGAPTGNVNVSDGTGDACTGLASAGTCSITFATAGTKTLTATYAGDSNFVTSSSAGTSQTVNPKLAITSTAFAILTGTCSSQVTVQTQNNDGSGANQTPARTLNLSSSPGTGKFFSDAACSNQVTTANIATGASSAGFYYDDTSIGTPLITVASTGLSSVTQTEAITGLRFSNAVFSAQVNSCSPALSLQSANTQNGTPTSLTQATALNLSSSSAGGKFYSDAACTIQITGTTISPTIDAGHDSPNFYYEDTTAGGPTITAAAGTASAQQAESIVMAPGIGKAFGAVSIPVSGTTSLTLTITNPAANTVALTGVAFTDNLPSGMVVATPNGLTNTCGGTATATPASVSVSLSGGTAAVNSSCKVTVNVTSTTSGVKNNTTGAVTSTNGGTGNTASASVTVASPPTISKAFGAASIPQNASTSLTFTISNPNTIGLTGVAFTDTLPAGMVVSTPNNLSSSCGTVTAAAGSGSISLSGGTIASSGSCTISVNVTGTTTGVKNNTTGVISATESGSGAASNTASLTVNTRTASTSIAPLTATAAIGQGSNFTITVTDTDSGPASTPTGNVAVSSFSAPSNTDSIGGCTLAQTVVGTASCMVTVTPTAPTGTHTISASFTANDNVHGNSSSTTSAALTVTNPATSTTLMSSPNPSTFGESVNFSATVSSAAGTPTGSVTFYESVCGGTFLAGPVSLEVNGQAGFVKSDFNAGPHTVLACYTPTGIYMPSSGSVSQQVNQAQATLSFGPLTPVYDGTPKPATVMTNPANLTGVSILYNGSSTPPTNAGSTPVTASLSNTNYVATPISDTEVIQQAPVMITVTDPHVTYDGNTHQAVIGVSPNVGVMVTYNLSPTMPTSAGVYPVAVTVTDPNYTGTGSGTLTINKATPTINWATPADITYGTALGGTQLNATATFGLGGPSVPGMFTYNPAAGTVLPAGSGQMLSADFAPTDSTDFNSVLGTTVPINVMADPLYVISPDNRRAFGASDSPLTPQLVGLVAGDTAASVGAPICNPAATFASLPGTYAIVCSAVTSTNYTVEYVNGTLTVTNPLNAITGVTDSQGGTIQIGQNDHLTATGQFADGNKRTLASAGGLSFGRADLTTAVSGAAVAEGGGVLYAIGGFDGTNTLRTIQAFSPKTNTWSTISAALVTPRTNAAVVSIAGKIYVIGGRDGSNNPLASIEVLDTTVATPLVSAFASSLTTARGNAAAVAWNQKLYVIAGTDASNNALSSVEIFDLVTGNHSGGDTGTPLAQASAAVVTVNSISTLYLVGASDSNVVALSTTDGMTWTGPASSSLVGANGVGAVAFNGSLYIVNGTSVWSYDGTTFAQASSALGNTHNASQPAAIGSRIYVASAGSGSSSAKLDAFAPAEVTWASADTTEATIDNSGNIVAVAITNPTVTLTATSISNNSIIRTFALTVIKKSQTIQFGVLANATYGAPDFMVSATSVDGGSNPTNLLVSFAASPANVCSVGASTLSGSTSGATVHITGAGDCTITASQPGDATTWQAAPSVAQSFTVNPAPLIITASSGSFTYGGTVPTITASYNTFVNGDTPASVTTPPTCSTNASSGSAVSGSPYWSTCSGAVDTNYNISYVKGSVTESAAPLTITAGSGSMIYGGPVFPVLPNYGGFVNSDTSVNLTTQPTCGTAATSSSPVGTYASNCWGAVDSNYVISNVPGSVTVIPASTTTAVMSSLNPSNWGEVVVLTATVTPQYAGTMPTGTVSFYNAASGATCTMLGSSTLLDTDLLATIAAVQQASTSTPWLPVGTDTVLACYNGDSNFYATGTGNGTTTTTSQVVNAAPIAVLSPASLSFGNQPAGTVSGPQTVTVSNPNGTAALSITSITVTGTNPSYFTTQTNNCSSVAVGSVCTITVKFAPPPQATGVATANLVVTDNNENVSGSMQSSLLTGAGTSSISSVGSLSTYAIFATASGCSSLNMSGNGMVDSFNSTSGPYSSSHENSGGNVGTDGNVTLSGNPVVYGTAASPFAASGNCSTKAMTGYSASGGAKATGGQVVLPQALTYPAPPAPNPAPPVSNQNISGSCGSIPGCSNNGSKNVILTPGPYGNLSVSGGTTVNISGGTYIVNSLTLSGNSTLVVGSGTGPVTVNLAGNSISGGNTALDLSGGVMSNASGLASNLQFYYAGFQPIKLSGGAASYAVVYAPNAAINVSGGSHFYGTMVGSTVNSSGGTAIHYDANLPNIQPGDYIWFNSSALNVQGLPTSGSVKLYVTDASISFPSTSSQCTGTYSSGQCSLPVPSSVVTFSSTASNASTTWDATNSRWSTLVPTNGSATIQAHTFLDGLAYLVPGGGFPTGIQNVTWSAAFSTTTTGISFNWQWGAAVYSSFTNNYSSLTVNPVDNDPLYGSDPAGTPENYKSDLIFGATGPGYTGLYVGTAGVVPTIAEASVSPSSLDFSGGGAVNQTVGTTSGPMTATLTNNQSGPLTINATNGIQMTGTDPADFIESDNCPIKPATLAGGGSCTITITFKPTAKGKRTAKIAVNDNANNTPQTVFLKGTGN